MKKSQRNSAKLLKIYIVFCILITNIILVYVIIGIEKTEDIELIEKYYESDNTTLPTIFCMILTSLEEINLSNRAKAVQEGWATKCDKHYFITMVNPELFEQGIEKEINGLPVLQPKNFIKDEYKLLTDKMYRTIIDVYNKHNKYDWYLKADDDTFIFVENLKRFLSTKNRSQPVTFGYDFKVIVKEGYHSGGGGYVWSREAMNRLGSELSKNYSFCQMGGAEDAEVAKCFRKVGVWPNSSLDELGRERFHALDIGSHVLGGFPYWMYTNSKNKVKSGRECCSESSISFHYIKPKDMKRLGKLNDVYELRHKAKNKTLFSLYINLHKNKLVESIRLC